MPLLSLLSISGEDKEGIRQKPGLHCTAANQVSTRSLLRNEKWNITFLHGIQN
jgi:hypothetical protein